MQIKLFQPFFINSALNPAVDVGERAELSFNVESGKFVLSIDGEENEINHFRFPSCAVAGQTAGGRVQEGFVAILSFLSACAESRNYAERQGKAAWEGENSNLFSDEIGKWAQDEKETIEMLSFELGEEANEKLIEIN